MAGCVNTASIDPNIVDISLEFPVVARIRRTRSPVPSGGCLIPNKGFGTATTSDTVRQEVATTAQVYDIGQLAPFKPKNYWFQYRLYD